MVKGELLKINLGSVCIIGGEGVTNPEKGGREYIVRVGNNQKYSSVSGIVRRVVNRVYVCPAFRGIANDLPKAFVPIYVSTSNV